MKSTDCTRAAVASLALWWAQPLWCSAAEAVRSMEIVEASAFLDEYRAASEAQSADFYDLYSDRAVIHVHVEGREQGVAFQGRAFKVWGRQLRTEGRAVPDASEFHEPTVEQRGNRLFIRAKRYSTTRCYWDLDYAVGIEREGSSYRIMDERLSTRPEARCDPSRASLIAPTSVVALPPPANIAPRMSSGLRTPDETAPWRPLSQQELADKAMQLAQQMSAARASSSHAGSAASTTPGAAVLATADPRTKGRRVEPLLEPATALRVTPEE